MRTRRSITPPTRGYAQRRGATPARRGGRPARAGMYPGPGPAYRRRRRPPRARGDEPEDSQHDQERARSTAARMTMRLPSTRDARTRPDARVPKDGGRVSTGGSGSPHRSMATNRRPVAAGQSCCSASRRRPSGRRRCCSGSMEHAPPARVLVLYGTQRAASARPRMWSSGSSSRSGIRVRRRGRKGGYGRHVARRVTAPVNRESPGLNRCPAARLWPSIVERRGHANRRAVRGGRRRETVGEQGHEGHRGAVPRSRRRTSTGPGRQRRASGRVGVTIMERFQRNNAEG